jgi:HlyD family secretion protein
MTARRFFILLGVLFVITALLYYFTVPRGNSIPLIGVVDGNEVIVSPQIAGRMIRLTVDEGDRVKKGQLIAELDPSELEAILAQDVASIASLEAKVNQSRETLKMTDAQTDAALKQVAAMETSMRSQLDQARANLELAEINYKRTSGLFEAGVVSAQSRDQDAAALKASQANVKSLEDQVRAQEAALAVARANRQQVQVQQADLLSTQAQLNQAKAARDQAQTQLGYTKIYAPLDGIVSVRVAKQGEMVAQGGPIVVLVDTNDLWVRADVEETYIDSIHFGDKLKVQLPSGDVLEGNVIFKGVEGGFATQRDVSRTKRDIKTFAVKIALPNPKQNLFLGMTATVLLPPPAAEKRRWFGN